MKYGFSFLSNTPIYTDLSVNCTVKSHFRFGEIFEILGAKNEFFEVNKSDFALQGYVLKSQVKILTKKEFNFLSQSERFYTTDSISTIIFENKNTLLSIGSVLYNFDGLVANFGFEKINFFGNAISEKQKLNTTQIENLIKKVLNAPMTTGGNSIFGLDSLGLIQFFYRFMQINVTGNLEEIIESNTKIDLVKNVKFGDIIFFGNKKIEHFGIVLSNKNILHVHGYARIDEYDYLGIKNFEKTDEYLFSKIYKIIRIL
jgi:hypothetical protein